MRITFVSRALNPAAPFGDQAETVCDLAHAVQPFADVTVLVSERHADGEGESALPEQAEIVRVAEPTGDGSFNSASHEWSENVWRALRRAHGDEPPDVIEFADEGGQAFVTLQAAASHDPWLARTAVAVRVHEPIGLHARFGGYEPSDWEWRLTLELERWCIGEADALLWPGGSVLADLRRCYDLTPRAAIHSPPPLRPAAGQPDGGAGDATPGRPALLCLNPVSSVAGTAALVDTFLACETGDWTLTLSGQALTDAPAGHSTLAQSLLIAAGDDRLRLGSPAPADRDMLLGQATAVVDASRWTCWPVGARSALRANIPVVGRPVGGLLDLVAPGRSGWRLERLEVRHLERLLAAITADRRASQPALEPAEHLRSLERAVSLPDTYRWIHSLARSARGDDRAPRRRGRAATSTAIIPFFRMPEYLERVLDSLAAQTRPVDECIVVDDGSGPEYQDALDRAAARRGVLVVSQPNRGTAAARNTGARLARGDHLIFVDNDDRLLPAFAERTRRVLDRRPEVAAVVAHSSRVGPAGNAVPGARVVRPLGNWTPLLRERNIVHMPLVTMSRRLFDAGWAWPEDVLGFEDWAMWEALRRHGLHVVVVPEILSEYLVRPTSVLHAVVRADERRHARLVDEAITRGARMAYERGSAW